MTFDIGQEGHVLLFCRGWVNLAGQQLSFYQCECCVPAVVGQGKVFWLQFTITDGIGELSVGTLSGVYGWEQFVVLSHDLSIFENPFYGVTQVIGDHNVGFVSFPNIATLG